jgi:hypothetical protein
MLTRRNSLIVALCALVMSIGAQQVSAQAADATGTWKYMQSFGGGRRGAGGGAGAAGGGAATQPANPPASQPGAAGAGGRFGGRAGGGQPREITLKLKQDGEKLTGQIIGANFQDPAAAIDIKDGTVKDGNVTFKVTRTFGQQEVTTTYKAKLDGDSLKGTSELEFNGNPISTEFDAKREKAS